MAEAAARGAADRLRPIVSTSLTTVLGLIPLAIGNPMWRPLCYAIIFGLIAATAMSLVIVPCLYLLLTRKRAVPAAAEVEADPPGTGARARLTGADERVCRCATYRRPEETSAAVLYL